ncbi:hypothetical protein PHSY_003535 [Pseudozyma hubeiensis SY62]|uniref:Homeobox domain-containing protein n=1 Tax=Pseudozyma hubeiensis (strain SY62) TaxID=1305764 RepID=R9P3Y7_PSEHS|nr:hypothetical protein PHSY_003535 [Pseudozyma hubeiensis SY62]GAC95957.1 hypothetical protein PHSY_003535 [Pseudozyma hubeiensis SY62]
MSQRSQRAAAVQASRANTAALASRRRSDSQASIQTITSQHVKPEERRYEGRSSPSMDVVMQRSSHQDLRRPDMQNSGNGGYGGNGALASNVSAAQEEPHESSYNSTIFPAHWTAQDDPSAMGPFAAQPSPASAYHTQQLWLEQPPHGDPHSLPYYDPLPHQGMFDLHYGYATQSNSLGLKGESALIVSLDGDLDLGQRMPREQRAFDNPSSEALALLDNLPFKANSSADNDSYEDSTDSDLPPEKKKLSAAFRPRGRKKRNKCTPDQLRSLEAFFEKNRNPTGRIRLELSRKLRMPERSVQVWFQNRRAKIKTVERRGDAGSDSGRKKSCSIRLNDRDAHSLPTGANDRSARSDPAELEKSVTAIPTSALCIGTWRRVSPLICFFSRRLQSLTWYLTSESIGFKLEVPWTSIRSAYFDGPVDPSIAERAEGVRVPLGHFVIDLERPPTFFMEVFRSAPVKNGIDGKPRHSWRQCEDFTEDHQAMTVSRHILHGPYEELRIAIQELASCNDVLRRLIQFRDEQQRALGAIPTGSSSTADNFRLVCNGVSLRPADAYAPLSAGPPPPAPPSMDMRAVPMTGMDPYGNGIHMSMSASVPMSTSSSTSSMHKATHLAWHNFRTPTRMGADHGWEFDSPASVSTNLSEASADSHQRHSLGYSPYGVPTSIEASPRSGLGSSMDINTLRIDGGGGVSSFGAQQHHNLPMMGDGGSCTALRGSSSFGGWDARLGHELSSSQHAEEPYSLASSGVLEGSGVHHASVPMTSQNPSASMDMNNFGAESFHRNGYERQGYSSNQITMADPATCHRQDGQQSNVETSYHQERRFDGKDVSNEHRPTNAGSLLLSRQFSYDASAGHNATVANGERLDRSDNAVRESDPSYVAPTLVLPTGSSGGGSGSSNGSNSASKMTSLDEDAFCSKTPTYRTCFGPSLEMSRVDEANEQQGSGGEERHDDDATGGYGSDHDDHDEQAGQGRARSNTYRPSAHVLGPQQSTEGQYGGGSHDAVGDAGGSVQDVVTGNGDDEGARRATSLTNASAVMEGQNESPGLLSLSCSSLSSSHHDMAKGNPSPMSTSSTSSLSSARSSTDQQAGSADEQ